MSDTDPPPPSGPEEGDSVPPPSPRSKDSRRRRLEGVIPEILKRAVELGVEKARESPENLKSFVGDMKLPKEIAHVLFAQIDETKNGLFRVVAKEIRDFLENTNISGELQKLLTTVQFEVNTTIRFTPNDGKKKKAADKGKKDAAARTDDVIYESESTHDLSGLAGEDDDAPESEPDDAAGAKGSSEDQGRRREREREREERERKKRGKSP